MINCLFHNHLSNKMFLLIRVTQIRKIKSRWHAKLKIWNNSNYDNFEPYAKSYGLLCGESPRLPQSSVIHQEELQSSVYSDIVAKIYCSKRIQNKNQHRKRHMGQNPKPGFRKFFPIGIIQNVLHSSRIKLWQQERSATGQFITAVSQKLWRDLAPKVFIGPSQTGTLCLTTAKIPDYGGGRGKQMFGINHMFVQMT